MIAETLALFFEISSIRLNPPSNIDTRERVEGETKKYGRFGNQYLTYEKHRSNRKNE